MSQPQSYGDYEVESVLGRGSIGKVYLARHRRLGRRVALKVVQFEEKFEDNLDNEEFNKRLQREAELCAALQHPNVVTLFEAGYVGDRVAYLATEYVEGETLLARLKRQRPLPLDAALAIAEDLLGALGYAHSMGVIHRDVKPANILLTKDGRAKIADFGIARPIESSLTLAGSLLGTPNYMSPEQVKSAPVTTRSDLFSAGTVLYEMLSGVKPFLAQDLSGILYNVVNLDPPLVSAVNPGVPEPLAQVVAKLMAKAAADRLPSADHALAEISRARNEASSLPHAEELGTIAAPTATAEEDTTPIGATSSSFAESSSVPRSSSEFLGVATDSSEELRGSRGAPRNFEVRPSAFWSIVGALLVGLAVAAAVIASRIDPQPTGVIPPQQVAEFASKRRALGEARAFAGAGNHAEAVKRYDAYLARYPQSMAARAERDAAQAALEAATKAEERVTVTAKKRRTREETAEKPAAEEEEKPKPPGRWERVKRWFRGK